MTISNLSSEKKAIFWTLSACAWSSIMVAVIRYASHTMPIFEIVFFRNVFCSICFLPWIIRNGFSLKTEKIKIYSYRAISGVIGMSTFCYAVSIIPITEVTALTFLTPIITVILAIIFLKEKIQFKHFIAMLLGMIGMIIIIKPDGNEVLKPASLFVLVTVISWSFSNIFMKKLSHVDPPKVVVCLMAMVMVPLSLPAALFVWQTPTMHDLTMMFALGFLTNQVQLSIVKAFSHADIVVTAPFDFFRLIFTATIGYALFGEILTSSQLMGALIIFTGSIYALRTKTHVKPVV